jgi:hypothetical protein
LEWVAGNALQHLGQRKGIDADLPKQLTHKLYIAAMASRISPLHAHLEATIGSKLSLRALIKMRRHCNIFHGIQTMKREALRYYKQCVSA